MYDKQTNRRQECDIGNYHITISAHVHKHNIPGGWVHKKV